ncbi:MAG: hypothetical protein K5765_01745 [Clostridia bacterium]|nr:hypothetical protein [Clostridia bacterium]
MQYNIYLLSYNNYYNRQVRRLESVQDYINGGYVLNIVQNVNFEMADGIFSKLVVNYQYVIEEPNYILVVDKTDSTKFTRWFVIESNLNRCGQYEFTVRRDVIAEYLNAVLDSPCMIKKGYVNNLSILSFNKEIQEYNKVKSAEKLLKDETNSGWVIGFIERDKNHSGAIKTTYFDSRPVDFDYDALPQSTKNYMGIAGATPISKLKILQDNDLHNVGIEGNFATY